MSINNIILDSKQYNEVKSRNAYTISYSNPEPAYGEIEFFFLPQPVYLQCFRRESPAELSLLSKWIVPVEVAEMDVHVVILYSMIVNTDFKQN